MKEKHGWNTWENYLRVHERVLKDYSSNIITSNPLYKIERVTENYYTLELSKIEVMTVKGNPVFIKIEKDIVIKEGVRKKLAKLYSYSYHAWSKSSLKNLVRYCSPHTEHNKFHHRHDYSVSPMKTTRVNDDEYPHVSEFLQEVIDSF